MTEDENGPSASSSSGVRNRRTTRASAAAAASASGPSDADGASAGPSATRGGINGFSDDEDSSSSSRSSPGRGESSAEGDDADAAPRASSNAGGEDSGERDLSHQEVEKLVQLQDVTGIDDLQVCRALLESKNWDLEATVMVHMNIPSPAQQRAEAARSRPIAPLPEAPTARVAMQEQQQRRPVVRPGGRRGAGGMWSTLFDWGFFLLMLPVTVPFRAASTAFQGVYNVVAVIFGLPALPGGGQRPAVRHGGGDPVTDVRRFRESFEAKYGAVHPPFHPGSYHQVLEEAKKELKFLLVYLHCADHQDVDRFCSGTLSSNALVEFVATNGILFWGCSVDTSEGYRVSQALRESTYPFLAVIVLRQNRMMVVGRVEGHIEPEPLVQRLEAIVRDNEAYIVAARHEREERSLNQSIREEQDRAFQETLRQDQEKERKKQEEADRKRREEEERQRLEREEQERKENIKRMKIELASEIPDEPDEKDAESVRVLVKLPGGQRLVRRFLKSHSLKYLYYYVFCHPESPDEFDITTNFPKKVLACRPEQDPVTFEEAGLGTSTMLFVNDLEA